MNAREQGFLLLTSCLGDPERKPLTVAQFRNLTNRARLMEKPEADRSLKTEDILALGFDQAMARRILTLLSQTDRLEWYLEKAKKCGCLPVTRISSGYPAKLHHTLGAEAPGVLWAKGDMSLLERPAITLVGSRELGSENHRFACEAGKQAALQGYVLISGNARGADKAAQESCLAHGGSVISVVADRLETCREQPNMLYLSLDGFDIGFSPQRALLRNRVIHTLGQKTLVAQCGLRKGGTWDGTRQNLSKNWSSVFCFSDGSPASLELEQMGAVLIGTDALSDIDALQPNIANFIDQ